MQPRPDQLDVRRIFVGGLATDYCVHASVLNARSHGFDVVVLADAIRGVNARPGDETRAIHGMLACGVALLHPIHMQRPTAHPVEPPRRVQPAARATRLAG